MKTTETPDELKQAGKADGSKRYDEDIFPLYHKEYSDLAKDSSVLNDKKRAQDFKNAGALNGIGECRGSLWQITGLPNKKYYRKNGSSYKALIPSAKEQLANVHQDYQRWQEKQVSNGIALSKPTHWPENHLKQRLKAEARLDVYRAEKHKIEQRIKELKKQQGKADTKQPILPNGPLCDVQKRKFGEHNRQEELDTIDGQNVSFTTDGTDIPYIRDEDSPYHLMPIATYRKMSKKWMKQHHLMRKDHRKVCNILRPVKKSENMAKLSGDEWAVIRAKEFINHYSDKFFDDGFMTIFSYKSIQTWMMKHNWPSNPEWPDDAKTIKEIKN